MASSTWGGQAELWAVGATLPVAGGAAAAVEPGTAWPVTVQSAIWLATWECGCGLWGRAKLDDRMRVFD
jgi:hypothetical protein